MSTPSTQGSVKINNLGQGPAITSVTWTLTILCVPPITVRFYVLKKVSVSQTVGAEDWLMLVAEV